MIRAVIVDDEPPARRKLRHLLAEDREVEVVAEAGSAAEAVEVIHREHPDLVFLDIQMPDASGFDVVEQCPDLSHLHYVFVTAYDDFAVKAFEVHALDYLLKPVEPSRFGAAMQRVKQLLGKKDDARLASRLEQLVAQMKAEPGYVRRLLIQENERAFFVETHRIDWLEAARNYVCVHAGGSTYTLRSTLEALAAKLDPARFRRINRSEIVNVERIAELRNWFHGDQKVILKNGTELMWSRRYRAGTVEDLERV